MALHGTSARLQALFGARKQVDPSIVEGCMVSIKGGEYKDQIGKVIQIGSLREEVEVGIIEGNKELGPRVTLQPGQVGLLDEIHGAINVGDIVSTNLSHLGPYESLALVTSVGPTRQSFNATLLREATDAEWEDGNNIVRATSLSGMVQTNQRFELLAGQSNSILSYRCIVRVEECRCDGRICKLLGPANGLPGPNLQIYNLQDEEGEDVRSHPYIHGISDDCMVLVAVFDDEILDITHGDRGYNRRKALEETPRHIPADEITLSQVAARSAPHLRFFVVPSGCLTLLHTEDHARGRFCIYCISQGELDRHSVCTDEACQEYHQIIETMV